MTITLVNIKGALATEKVNTNVNVNVPNFGERIFYPYSGIDNGPLVCTSDACKYICVFVDYMPTAYPTAIESCYMRDLVEYAQARNVDRFVMSYGNQITISLLLCDYIEAARPK